ncbi:MAG: Uma2 family endonuclease [Defluviitaleaceae bacterium]|nr:Uma2 family endonuclease [Defluviitaleaceae bacterium]
MTYSDYLKLGDDFRCEIIDGQIYAMAAPRIAHQRVAQRIWKQLDAFLAGRRCEAFIAPLDVRLSANKRNKHDDTVVQPDVFVLCDKNKIDKKGQSILGAPDMVIEVLSQGSAYVDRVLKHKKYLEAGVREYWIADPDNKTVEVYVLENNRYYSQNYSAPDIIPGHVLEGLKIDLAEIFAEE